MTKEEMVSHLEILIEEAKKQEILPLLSILYTLTASILEDSIDDLSDYTCAFSMHQIKRQMSQNNSN